MVDELEIKSQFYSPDLKDGTSLVRTDYQHSNRTLKRHFQTTKSGIRVAKQLKLIFKIVFDLFVLVYGICMWK